MKACLSKSFLVSAARISTFLFLGCVVFISPWFQATLVDAPYLASRFNQPEENSIADQPFAAIDRYIEAQIKANHIPGVALAITKDDQIVHVRGFGIADPSGRLMTPQTPMLIGSVSKSFTALAIIQLVEAGKLDLQAPVKQYLPWFSVLPPVAQTTGPGAPLTYNSGAITITHLLSHTSGISRASGERLLADGDTSPSALERHVRLLSREHLVRPTGSGFEYSNANFNVLGMVLQAVSGQSYADYIQQHIFQPLDMQHSYTSKAEAQAQGMAIGYRQWFGFPLPAGRLPFVAGDLPSGYLISSTEDLGHYLIAQTNQGNYQGKSVLSPLLMNTMHLPAVPARPEGYHRKPSGSYANGWYLMELNRIPVVTHDGDTPNYHADIVMIPSGRWGVALLINTNTVLLGEPIRDLVSGVTSLLSDRPVAPVNRDRNALFLYTFMAGLLCYEIFRLVQMMKRWFHPANLLVKGNKRWFIFRYLVLPILVGMLVGFTCLVGMPGMFQVSLAVMLLNQPDLTWVIILAGVLALINGPLASSLNGRKIFSGRNEA